MNIHISVYRCHIALTLAIIHTTAHSASADTLRMDARTLIAKSIAKNVRIADDDRAIELERDELFEDDGPAAGFSYKPNEEKLSATTWIKREFIIGDPRANNATLLIAPGGQLQGTLNGKPVQLVGARKVGQYWQANDLPSDLIKPGKNEVILHGSGKVWIARDDEFALGSVTQPRHPNRSAKSVDAGKMWDYDRLGTAGNIDGEYYVRLYLERFRPQGTLTLPVIDAGNLANQPIAPLVTAVGKLRISASGTGKYQLRVRTSSTYVPDAKTWTPWTELGEQGGSVERPAGRYLQLAVVLETTNPLVTPRLAHIAIEADPQRPADWTNKLRVVEMQNEEIVRTSIPFEYEPFDHPQLRKLRQDFKLDAVVEGAKSELELITRLAGWSSRQWQRGHLRDGYPPWDALEILKPHKDETPIGGFCQQYNVVFLQACESFGLVGRAVSLGAGDHGAKIRSGHEVVEIWSNEYKKWVYVDGQLARYLIDEKSGQPLSLWELRERQVAAFRGKSALPVKAVQIVETERWEGFSSFPPYFELRLIPRSNFLAKKAPLPLNQGMRGWFWTGHHVWTDADYPASLLYGNRVNNRRNWEWTLNQAHCKLEATETPGVLRVHLDTETPGFETFLADIDTKGKRPIASGFLWRLHESKNQLEIRPRNLAGREGITSKVAIELRN